MSMNNTLLMYAALLPAIVLLVYVYSKDKVEREPVRLILRLLGLGALAGPIAGFLEGVLISFFQAIVPIPIVFHILEFFIGVAVVEEGLKYLALSTIRKNPEFNYVFDGIVYAVAASLGFAALENVLYVFSYGWQTAIMRAIISVPGHCAYGVLMGCFFGLARHREIAGNARDAKLYYWLAFILPVVEHGFFDAGVSSESGLGVTAALMVQVAVIIATMILVHKLSLEDQAIYPHATQPPTPQQQAAHMQPMPHPTAPAQATPQQQAAYVQPTPQQQAAYVQPTPQQQAAQTQWAAHYQPVQGRQMQQPTPQDQQAVLQATQAQPMPQGQPTMQGQMPNQGWAAQAQATPQQASNQGWAAQGQPAAQQEAQGQAYPQGQTPQWQAQPHMQTTPQQPAPPYQGQPQQQPPQ